MGAGVQTTALLFMALAGEIGPRPDAMIFADTGDEIDATMKHLAFCEGEVARLTNGQMASYRVERGGRLSDRVRIRSEGRETRIANDRFVSAPFFVNGKESVGQGRRQCTR